MDKELNIENVEVPEVNSGDQSTGLIQTLLKKISDNKMYLYIAVAVIVLGVLLYYFYFKSKKEIQTLANTSNDKPQLALPKQNNENQTVVAANDNVPVGFNPNSNDYFVLDANGNPVKVSGTYQNNNQQLLPLPMPKQQPSQQEIQMLQKQMLEKQMMEQQIMQQQMKQQQMMQQQMMQQQMMQQQMAQQQNKQVDTRSKLQHPDSDEENDNGSDDINIELARIQANEDDNVAQHNLTNSELAEISKKIEMMNAQNN